MDKAILAMLEDADHPTHIEGDPSLDWNESRERVARLKVELEAIAGRSFKLDDGAQDASFWCDLTIQRPNPKPNWVDTVFAIRFSNFGMLCTTWSHCETERLSDGVIAELMNAVSRAGFRYVPAEVLNAAYTGRNPAFAGCSWWIRFFDYI